MPDYYATVLRQENARKAERNLAHSLARAVRQGRGYAPSAELVERASKRRKPGLDGRRPFVGVDGEGGGTNAKGQQYFRLLRAGSRLLFDDNRPLGTVECLEFLLNCPKRWLMVGFGFNYDATQMLRDVSAKKLERLMHGPPEGSESRYTYWSDYALEYMPGQHFRVARTVDGPDGNPVLVEGSARTIYEVAGFFQCSFIRALEQWGIGDQATRERIAAVKNKRQRFGLMTAEHIAYNDEECRWLAELMTEFRRRCHAANIKPQTWNGAGKIAQYLHRINRTPRADTVRSLVESQVFEASERAYFGGRAELSTVGFQHLWASDLRSAYPAAMLDLPCLEHGTWHRLSAKECAKRKEGEIFVADVRFWHPKEQIWCGLPWRYTAGGLCWPRMGRGTYWAVEIHAAKRLGATIHYEGGWLYRRRCNCQPFAWVKELYEERKRLDRISPGMGTPIKLGINSLYGKLAQRLGRAPFRNPIWAGLITAITRAKLIDAINSAPGGQADVIALATDCVFSRRPLPALDLGSELGDWEDKDLGEVFFLMPGVYWSVEGAVTVKTRGMDKESLALARRKIESHWRRFSRRIAAEAAREGLPCMAPMPYPVVPVTMKSTFIGLRLAWARGDLSLAGHWTQGDERVRKIAFAWGTKRTERRVLELTGAGARLAVLTAPQDGTPRGLSSTTWHKAKDRATDKQGDFDRYLAEDQPDWIDPASELLGEA